MKKNLAASWRLKVPTSVMAMLVVEVVTCCDNAISNFNCPIAHALPQVLRQLTSVVNYGGRITDDKDMRTSDIIIAGFYNPDILSDGFAFSRSGR